MKRQQQQSKPKSKRDEVWKKIKGVTGLYQYRSSGTFFANVRKSGKLHTESLHTKDGQTARRLLRDFKARLDRTDARFGKISFVDWLEQHYQPALKGAESTLTGKARIIGRVKETWVAARTLPMADLKPSQVERWLNEQYGNWTAGTFNGALTVIRDALERAVQDRALLQNPAAQLKYAKRARPVRLTPSWEEFCCIVRDVRSQRFNATSQESADFIEACRMLGLGQAELAGMKREHVDLEAGRVLVFRKKTRTPFFIPLYPQARALVTRLCQNKRHHERLFEIDQARRALRNACKRLGYPMYSHRALRRCFIVRCLELGIDAKTVSEFQGHVDGGVLVMQVYSHVRPAHAQRMAQLLTVEQPPNVIQLEAGENQASVSA